MSARACSRPGSCGAAGPRTAVLDLAVVGASAKDAFKFELVDVLQVLEGASRISCCSRSGRGLWVFSSEVLHSFTHNRRSPAASVKCAEHMAGSQAT